MVRTENAPDWRRALDMLQRLGCGGIVIDRSGIVLARNDVAAKLAGDWSAALPPEAQKIVDDLAHAPGKVSWFAPTLERPLILHLVTKAQRSADATRLLVLIDPGQPAAVDEGVVRNLFGLTRTEANLAVRLARGERVHAIAQARGVSLGTVRTHLRTVFAKTRTKSQAGLVLLLARLTTIQPEE